MKRDEGWGNEEYRKLVEEEREWRKDAPYCRICNEYHPVHKSDSREALNLPEMYLE